MWRRTLFLFVIVSLLAGAPRPTPQALASAPTSDEEGNYIIIIPDSSFAAAVAPLQQWKEKIGYKVRVVTLNTIYSLYSGDHAERIHQYLQDRYPPLRWGIRYVLLIGDLDRMPIRMLYPDGGPNDGSAYASDFYYANLSMTNWDLDGDSRWGEFTHDHLDRDLNAEVAVGRIPSSDPNVVATVCSNIVRFEQDIGAWKRYALLAHGIMDYGNADDRTHADMGDLGERLLSDFFDPFGWQSITQYETGGIWPTTWTPDQNLSQLNYENACAPQGQGVVNVVTHGAPNLVGSLVWPADLNGNGLADGPPISETAWNDYSVQSAIATHPTTGIVFLCGCSTGALVGDDPYFITSTLRSRYEITATRSAMMLKEYLANGAPAVIAATAGGDYGHKWSGPEDGNWQSLNYYFYRHLIEEDRKAGDAFFAAQEDYARLHRLQRGIRVFNYFGDPSLNLKGVEDRPGGGDTLVKEGSYYGYAADYAQNGDLYVPVLASAPAKVPGFINIYRSTDHGQHWSGWTWVDEPDDSIYSLATLVTTFQGESGVEDDLHIIYSTAGGRVVDVRVNRADPDQRQTTVIANLPRWPVNLSATRTPVITPGYFVLHVAWAYTDLQGVEQVVVYRSTDNGSSWSQSYAASDALMPHVEAGPGGRVHLAMLADNDTLDVVTVRSLDDGRSWERDLHNLTAGDGALMHTAPVVGTSNDPAYPAVWVAYDYEYQHPVRGDERDLRFAFSRDGGQSWIQHRLLSGDAGVHEWVADLSGARGAPNRWVNVAYNYDPQLANGYQRNVVWQWSSGGLPNYWSPQRITNDVSASAPQPDRPLILLSPGAPVSGSGVVYGEAGRANLHFSAPWLTTPLAAVGVKSIESVAVAPISPSPTAEQARASAPAVPAAATAQYSIWRRVTGPEKAMAITAVTPSREGVQYAAAVVGLGDRANAGRVFQSTDSGETWDPSAPFADCWSATSVLQMPSGAVLAGGLSWNGSQVTGVVYRSKDGGATWTSTLALAGGAVYRLVWTGGTTVWAATGWQGELFKSLDEGQTWAPAGALDAGTTVHALVRTRDNLLVVAAEGPAAGRILRSADGGATWKEGQGLGGVSAVYALHEAGGRLFAGVRAGERGGICIADLQGAAWSCMFDLPGGGVRSVRTFASLESGELFAAGESSLGRLTTDVFVKPAGGDWQVFGGEIDDANAVYTLAASDRSLYAGTGIYGGMYKIVLPNDAPVMPLYLPLIKQ